MTGAVHPEPANGTACVRHVPVMLEEVLHFLAPARGGFVIDGTFGAGGYTRALLSAGADVLAIDRDPDAIARGAALVAKANGRLCLLHGRFSELDAHARGIGRSGADGVVLDIGVSSMQIDEAERGFSFRFDGPLDMRMERSGPSAADVVNEMPERDLARLIALFGEEKKSGYVARAIATRRAERPFETTADLADVVGRAVGRRFDDTIDPATRTFQALRIYVNAELDELAEALGAAERILKPGGRLVVVSFHSLEDRIVKRFLADRSRTHPGGSRHMPEANLPPATFTLLAKGAETPGEAECAANPRARSARLRAAVRTDAPARAIDMAALGVPQLEKRGRR
ncbi:MAG TPA: 16S rRNA (cytosine(1402)-N(4))-methyltransferase RsmH [Kaistiaceae bacterium]|nr:16S rRNA (cytosine(1402)-N(4))-methyltransferase RsmH [Kaistiaceae bacterium]